MTATTSDSRSEAQLPVIPARRAAHCPLHPPPEFAQWREEPGLRRAMWGGLPVWSVSRYQDIRAALVDPRLSADTISSSIKPSSDEGTPVIFARTDDPEHHRLRRMMTSQFTFRRCEAMRPQIQVLVDQYLHTMIDNGPPADIGQLAPPHLSPRGKRAPAHDAAAAFRNDARSPHASGSSSGCSS